MLFLFAINGSVLNNNSNKLSINYYSNFEFYSYISISAILFIISTIISINMNKSINFSKKYIKILILNTLSLLIIFYYFNNIYFHNIKKINKNLMTNVNNFVLDLNSLLIKNHPNLLNQFYKNIEKMKEITKILEVFNISISEIEYNDNFQINIEQIERLQNKVNYIILEFNKLLEIITNNLKNIIKKGDSIETFVANLNDICSVLNIKDLTIPEKIEYINFIINDLQKINQIILNNDTNDLNLIIENIKNHIKKYEDNKIILKKFEDLNINSHTLMNFFSIMMFVINENEGKTFENINSLIDLVKNLIEYNKKSQFFISDFCSFFNIKQNNIFITINDILEKLNPIIAKNITIQNFYEKYKENKKKNNEIISQIISDNFTNKDQINFIKQLEKLLKIYEKNKKEYSDKSLLDCVKLLQTQSFYNDQVNKIKSLFSTNDINILNTSFKNNIQNIKLNGNVLIDNDLIKFILLPEKTLNDIIAIIQGLQKSNINIKEILLLNNELNENIKKQNIIIYLMAGKDIEESINNFEKIHNISKNIDFGKSIFDKNNINKYNKLYDYISQIDGYKNILKLKDINNVFKYIDNYKESQILLTKIESICQSDIKNILDVSEFIKDNFKQINIENIDKIILEYIEDFFRNKNYLSIINEKLDINSNILKYIKQIIKVTNYNNILNYIKYMETTLQTHLNLVYIAESFGTDVENIIDFLKNLHIILIYTQFNNKTTMLDFIKDILDISSIEKQSKIIYDILNENFKMDIQKIYEFFSKNDQKIEKELKNIISICNKYDIRLVSIKEIDENIIYLSKIRNNYIDFINKNKDFNINYIFKNLEMLNKNFLMEKESNIIFEIETKLNKQNINNSILKRIANILPALPIQNTISKPEEIIELIDYNFTYILSILKNYENLIEKYPDLNIVRNQYIKLINALKTENINFSQYFLIQEFLSWCINNNINKNNVKKINLEITSYFANIYNKALEQKIFYDINLNSLIEFHKAMLEIKDFKVYIYNINKQYNSYIICLYENLDKFKKNPQIKILIKNIQLDNLENISNIKEIYSINLNKQFIFINNLIKKFKIKSELNLIIKAIYQHL